MLFSLITCRPIKVSYDEPFCNWHLQLCANASMTFPTASKAMQRLGDAGIVRELTGQRRHRVFIYDAYLAVLNEGGEPL